MKTSHIFTVVAVVGALAFILPSQAAANPKIGLTSQAIQRVVGKDVSKVRDCYTKHAMKQRGANGKVSLNLLIRGSGKLRSVKVDAPSVKGKKFERCVKQIAETWQFPKSGGSTEVSYPFLFVHAHASGAGPRVPGRR